MTNLSDDQRKYLLKTTSNSFRTVVPIIQKPVHWFAEKIYGLVSTWWGPPSWVKSNLFQKKKNDFIPGTFDEYNDIFKTSYFIEDVWKPASTLHTLI